MPLPVTVAVNVTLWPKTVGLIEDTMVVVVPACPTVCVSVKLLLVLKFVSPE
jgi:hypothetical protein